MDHLMYTIEPLYWEAPTWERVAESVNHFHQADEKCVFWKEAVEFLRQEFGKGFFDTCGRNHPICMKLTSNLHSVDDVVEFTSALRNLKKVDPANYQVLMGKLKPRKKCQTEGIPFMEIYRTYTNEGFQVKFLREKLDCKNADIELIDPITNNSIFIEVSQLLQSSDQRSIEAQHKTLSNAFNFFGDQLPKACIQLQPMDNERLETTVRQIKTIKVDAVNDRKFIAYENEFVRMAVAHPEKLHELDEWCKGKGLTRNTMQGLPVDYNDTPRLVGNGKVKEEIKQLPPDKPGLVYIPVSFLYFLNMYVPDTAVPIMEQLIEFPNCLGVVLYAPSMGSLFKEERISVAHTEFSVRIVNGITRHVLFIGNPCFKGELSTQTTERFKQCLY